MSESARDGSASGVHGLVVGRFLPPHAGHAALVRRALAACGRVTVCLLPGPAGGPADEARADWLRELHPTADVVVAAGDGDAAAVEGRAALVREAVGTGPARLFGCGERDAALARRLGLDFDEGAGSALSTAEVRRDPVSHWAELGSPVRAALARRVVVTGAESTGKTTLCRRLAGRFRSVWVPEFGRDLTVLKSRTMPPEPWQPADFSWIAAEQERLAVEAARRGGPVVFVDTDAIATRVWEERYLERASHATERIAAASRADLYLLTLPDVPWIADGVRDGDQEIREWMTARLRDLLERTGAPVVDLSGAWADRDRAAEDACAALLADRAGFMRGREGWRPPPVHRA